MSLTAVYLFDFNSKSNITAWMYFPQGSGKTFTVGGGNINSQMDEEFGIIPRAIRNMFEIMQVQQRGIL